MIAQDEISKYCNEVYGYEGKIEMTGYDFETGYSGVCELEGKMQTFFYQNKYIKDPLVFKYYLNELKKDFSPTIIKAAGKYLQPSMSEIYTSIPKAEEYASDFAELKKSQVLILNLSCDENTDRAEVVSYLVSSLNEKGYGINALRIQFNSDGHVYGYTDDFMKDFSVEAIKSIESFR